MLLIHNELHNEIECNRMYLILKSSDLWMHAVRNCATGWQWRIIILQKHQASCELITSKKRFFNSTWKVDPAHALSGTSTARRIFVGSDSLSSDDMIGCCKANFKIKQLDESATIRDCKGLSELLYDKWKPKSKILHSAFHAIKSCVNCHNTRDARAWTNKSNSPFVSFQKSQDLTGNSI